MPQAAEPKPRVTGALRFRNGWTTPGIGASANSWRERSLFAIDARQAILIEYLGGIRFPFASSHPQRHHLETVRCGVARGRHRLQIIDAVISNETPVLHAALPHPMSAGRVSKDEGFDVDDDL
jgi:hypothetical protein